MEEKLPGSAPSYLRPGAFERIFGRTLVLLVWIGLVRGHFCVLEVRGRKSGRTISLPVDPLDLDGQRYLVCARGNSNWVRNARTAGEVQRFFPVPKGSPVEAFNDLAPRYPVFALSRWTKPARLVGDHDPI